MRDPALCAIERPEVAALSAVIVAFGETPDLPAATARLLESRGVDVEVIIVDNGSTDGSVLMAAGDRRVTVIEAGSNEGFGAGCNVGAAAARKTFLAFVNPDVLVEPDALLLLSEVASDPDVGIATASVRLRDQPDRCNSSGGAIHFLGLGWAEDFGRPVTSRRVREDRDVLAASGAAMVVRRDRFLELGGFTEPLFLYHEDAELSLRCWMHGWKVRYVASAVVLHDYDFSRNPRKLYLLERNRLLLVMTCYSARTLLLLAPALLAYEGGISLLALAQGWGADKARGWTWIVRHASWVRHQRRLVQRGRRTPDLDLAPLFAARFSGAQIALPKVLAPGDQLLSRYWNWIRRWL